MFTKKNCSAGLLGVFAWLSSPGAELVPPHIGFPLMAVCLAAIVYVLILHDYRKVFLHKKNRVIAASLILMSALIVSGVASIVWLKYPREVTNIEMMNVFYSEGDEIASREINCETDWEEYKGDYADWYFSLRRFAKQNISTTAAASIFNASQTLPVSRDYACNDDHRRRINTAFKILENLNPYLSSNQWQ